MKINSDFQLILNKIDIQNNVLFYKTIEFAWRKKIT